MALIKKLDKNGTGKVEKDRSLASCRESRILKAPQIEAYRTGLFGSGNLGRSSLRMLWGIAC